MTVLAGSGSGGAPERSDLGTGRTYATRAYRELRHIQPEIVHCHAHWYTLAAGVRYSRDRPGTPLIFSFHTTVIPWLPLAFSRLLRSAKTITFVSAAQLAEVRSALRLDGELRILQPAIDPSPIDPIEVEQAAIQYHLPGAFPILVFTGPLEYARKVDGVVELVNVVRQIRVEHPRVKLLIVGDGGLRGRVEAAAAGLDDAVTVTGFLPNPKALMANADLYCHISRQEGLPIALLEAMSMARCIVASRTGGIPEVIDDANGMLVDGEDSIAAGILQLAREPDLRIRLGTAARQTIRQHYTWDARWPVLTSIYGLG